jgi:UDP-GlcNAc:undecaprenyl-phosphate GlcNAc-1-phosphate transferase
MFQADRGHIHHRLLALGLSSRNVVLVIYGVTLTLCLLPILIATHHNEAAGLILIILVVGMLLLVSKLGYLEYLAFDKFYGWFKDLTDVAGFSRERRTFLALQMEANKASTFDRLFCHFERM